MVFGLTRRSLTMVELLGVFCAAFILIGVFAIYANITLRTAREVALKNELNNIRMSIEHYRALNSEYPEDLVTLVNKVFTTKYPSGIIRKNRYLEPIRVNEDEEMLDPFLNRYYYNKGRVKSNTKGYESW